VQHIAHGIQLVGSLRNVLPARFHGLVLFVREYILQIKNQMGALLLVQNNGCQQEF
jgi:hypothetical protein